MASSQPRFLEPPVIETVMGVHFRPLPKLTASHQALFWDRFLRTEFPAIEERPAVDDSPILFGEDLLSSVEQVGIRWRVGTLDPTRLWAKSGSGDHILQIQQSYLLANWLRTGQDEYLHYADRKSAYSERLAHLVQFVSDEELGPLEPITCVVRYINHIPFSGTDTTAEAFAKIFPMWSNITSDGWLPQPDLVKMQLGFPMPDARGRLDVTATPVKRKEDQSPVIRLDLTARGTLQSRSLDAALEWLDLGHEWVVFGFASITALQMHEVWKRVQ